jgi:RES domain-containing protein
MLIYRICRAEHSMNLNASGFAARWNLEGQFVLYASATRSLAALELLTRRNGSFVAYPYKVMCLEVSMNSIRMILPESLPLEWRKTSSYGALRAIGSDWYKHAESLVLGVPSVLVPQEFNYLIHTRHAEFASQVRIAEVDDFEWDSRL